MAEQLQNEIMAALEKPQAPNVSFRISGDHITSNNTVNQKIEGKSSPAEVPAVLVEQEHGVVDAAADAGSSAKSETPDEQCRRSTTNIEGAEARYEGDAYSIQQTEAEPVKTADITTLEVDNENPPEQDEPSKREASNTAATKTVDPKKLPINRIKYFPRPLPSLFPEREIGQFEVGLPEDDKIRRIVSSSDQSMLALGSRKGRIILYRFVDENGDQMIGLSRPSSTPTPPSEITPAYQGPAGFLVEALAFSPDNEFLAAMFFSGYDDNGSGNSKRVLFRTKDGTCHSETDLSSPFFSLAFSYTSKKIAIGGENSCRMFDLEKASLKEDTIISYDLEQANISSLSFCPGDDKLLVGTENGTENGKCLLFDSKGLKLLNRLEKGRGVFATAFSPDGMMYAIGTRGSTYLHGTSTGQLIHSFDNRSYSIKFSIDGTRVYCNDPYRTKKIYGYDVISGEKLFEQSISDLDSFALIGGDSQMVIGSEKVVRIVETAVTLKVEALEDGDRECIDASMSKDGDIMVICHGNGEGGSIYNSLGKRIQKLEGYLYSTAFSAKGDKLAVGGDGNTEIYSMTKNTDEAGFQFVKQFKIDHKAEGEGNAKVTQVVFFTEDGKDIIASVLKFDWQDTWKIVVHSAEEGRTQLHADITVPYSYPSKPVEVVPGTSFLKVWNGNQHEVYYYTDGNVHDRFNFNFQGDIKPTSRFSPDGLKLLVVIGKQLRVYNYSGAEEVFNASNEDIIKTVELSHDDAHSIEMTSHDGKNVVAVAFKGGAIDVIAFESDWKEGKALYTIATNSGGPSSMVFRPNSNSDSTCRLIVTGGYTYQSYEIGLSGINPTQPFFLLEKCYYDEGCDNEEEFIKQCARSSNQKSIPFRRNEDGDTLLQKAFVKGHSKYVELAIKESPEAVLALYYIRPKLTESGEWKGDNSIIESFAKKNEIDQFKQILPSPELLTKFEPSREELINIVSCIGTLASYNATDALNTVLDVSANGCIPGLIPGRKVWFLEPQNKYTSILTKIEDIFKFLGTLRKKDSIKDSVSNQPPQEDVPLSVESQNDEEHLPLVYASRIPPQNSPYNHNIQFMGHEDDEQKRIQLNMCRVLLPNLASMSNLGALLNMKEQYPGDTSSLKLFGKRSLHDSINAAWNSWAQKMLYWQLLYYCTWLISITALANIRMFSDISGADDAVQIILMCIVSVGCIYFTYLEARQAIHENRGFSQYFGLSWNLQQLIGLVCTILFVIMELVRPMGDAAIVCGALSQLFGWVNLLYYMRGIEDEVTWVVYALLRVIRSMRYFVGILFLVVFACALFIWSMELPNDFGRFGDVLLDTFFTSFFGTFDPDKDLTDNHFDPDSDLSDDHFKTFTLLFNLVVLLLIPLICLNAMIAFVSETFADILDDKIAVIAREKANLIMDLYCGMRKSRREVLEKDNAWTFKLELQSTLDKIDVCEDGEVANKRSTKGDIARLRIKADEGTSKIKELTKEMKTEMTEMKTETTEMKTEMNDMKLKMDEIKENTDEMRTLILQLLQQQQQK